ncbi:MAG: transporter substrate-binding domain-containing protein, partial [Proteobacteria bacterium]|nr:transporter substrate-binding domain-containing protein [Pseudomonadota bacterium]
MINRLIFDFFNMILHKIFACVLFCFLYFVFLSSSLYANEIEGSNTSDNSQKLVIASSNNFPPINTLDDNGQLTGFGRDLSTAVAKSQGIKVQYIHSGNWPNVLKWLDEGTADLIHDTGFTTERESYLDFTVPILEMPESIFVLNWQYDIQDISSLSGKKVACVNHHITHLYLQQFKEIQCYLVNTPVEGLLALINGKVDAFIYPEQIVLYLSQQLKLSDKLKVVGNPLRVLSWSMTVKKGNKKLLEKLNRGINAVKKSGKYKKIYNKWFGKHLFSGYSTKSVFTITMIAVLLSIFLVVTIGLLFYVRGIKKANQALADSENKYKTLIDKLPMNVFLKDTNSVYLSCNQRYADSLGIESEDIIGKNDFDFHPDNAQIYQSGDKVIMLSGETHDFVENFIDNGREIFVHTIKTPVYNDAGELTGVLGLFWDITAEKEAQQEIILKEKEQREMLDSMVSAVLTIDDTGKILTFNKAAEKLFGYMADEIIGQTVNHLMPDSSAGRHDSYLKHYDKKRELNFIKLNREVIGQTKDKETFPIFVSVAELPHHEGEHRHFIASCQDLTEIKQQQEQIRQ